MREQRRSVVTEEQRRAAQKDERDYVSELLGQHISLGEWSVRFTAPPVVSVGPTSVLRCERAGKFQSVTIGLKRDSRVAVPLLEPEVIDRWHLRAKQPQLRSTAYPCGAPRRRIAIGAKRVGHLMKAAGIRPHPPTHS